MEPERQEVYERIPWETLERQGNNRQWLVFVAAGAVVVGALAYSFVSNQPGSAPIAAAPSVPPSPVVTAQPPFPVTPSTVATPIVVAEADLFAVHPERLMDLASNHAEWFAVEYFTVDESDQSHATLKTLLPEGIPLPEASSGTQVFVDWVGVRSIVETHPLQYEIEVVVRSLMSTPDSGFVRQPARISSIEVAIGDDGLPRVTRPPGVRAMGTVTPLTMSITEVPEELRHQAEMTYGAVVGGTQLPDGRWQLVVLSEGVDGVRRPVSVTLP